MNSFIPNTSSSLNTIQTNKSPGSLSSSNSLMISQDNLFDKIKNIKWWVWLIVFFILAFLGFNIFTYLGNFTDFLIDLWNSFAGWLNKHFGTNFSELAKQTINVSATGAKGAVDVVQSSANTGIDMVSNSEGSEMAPAQDQKEPPPQEIDNIVQNGGVPSKGEDDIEAAPAYSSVGSVGQAGWCFIGEDQGVRTCSKVGQNDVCMSGDVFPTQDVCVNPNLRA